MLWKTTEFNFPFEECGAESKMKHNSLNYHLGHGDQKYVSLRHFKNSAKMCLWIFTKQNDHHAFKVNHAVLLELCPTV